MRTIVDIAAHVLPQRYAARLAGVESPYWEDVAALTDLDARLAMIDRFSASGYRQIISVAVPPPETVVDSRELPSLCARLNEELAELVADHPAHFAGALGHLPLTDPAACERELAHLAELGIAGFQCFSDVGGRPLDDPFVLRALETALSAGLACFLHPARMPLPDYAGEDASRHGIWRTFGWPYATTVALARLAHAGLFRRLPHAIVIAHHGGAMLPFFEGRLAPEIHADLGRLHADTAVSGSLAAARCALEFFGAERMLFGSDTPFGPGTGAEYIERTIAVIDALDVSDADRAAIESGNATRLLGLA